MTKKELADVIHTRIGLSKRESAEIVEFFFELAKDKLSSGGRNPATGETIEIAERKAVVFKPSRFLRDAIDKQTA